MPHRQPIEYATLPAGQLLYEATEAEPYCVARSDRTRLLWVVERDWRDGSAAAGPFRPDEILRALRLANTRVPEGCERGPWRWGLGLFKVGPLPGHPKEWTRVDSVLLEPSVSHYSSEDIAAVQNDRCCAPAGKAPQVEWNEERVTAVAGLESFTSFGVLKKEWNAHPAASLVAAEDVELRGKFVVVDLPAGSQR